MGTDKRARKKSNRAARLAEQQAAEARRRRLVFIRNAVILVVVLVIVLFLVSCGSSASDGDEATGDATTTTVGTTPTTAEPAAPTCPPAGGAKTPTIDFTGPFPRCIDPAKTYDAVVTTTEGTVTVRLDAKGHPITTNNFVSLARSGYYDGTALFRTEAATGIIQGGSPHTQDNTDPGPGYTIEDEGGLATPDDYGPGTLAMARTAAPNSASAQFFFLATDGGRYLGDPAQGGDGSYRVFGKVTEGLDVLVKISQLDNGQRVPSKPVSITTVKITES